MNCAAVHLSNRGTEIVGDIKVAVGSERHVGRITQAGQQRRTAISAVGRRPIPHHGGDDALAIHLPNHAIAGIGDVEVTLPIHGEPDRAGDLRLGRRSAVTAIARFAGSHDGGDDLIGPDSPDYEIVLVVDVEVALGIKRNAGGVIEACQRRRTAVAAVLRPAVARHGRDLAVRIDLPDDVVERVGDENVARAIHGDGHWPIQGRALDRNRTDQPL